MSTATIPPGLTELLEEFAVAVLREKPSDLVDFAAEYFGNLRRSNQTTTSSQQRARPAPTEDQMESEIADTAGNEVEMTTYEGNILSLYSFMSFGQMKMIFYLQLTIVMLWPLEDSQYLLRHMFQVKKRLKR